MDPVSVQTLSQLETAIQNLLPSPLPPEQNLSVAIFPHTISPTGIGALAGIHNDPAGEIIGRRVQATATVTASADAQASLTQLVTQLSQTLLTQEHASLRQQGIFKLTMSEMTPITLIGAGANTVATRDINFDVLYEYLNLPSIAGDTIQQIEQELDLNNVSRHADILLNTGFDNSFLDNFDIIDDPQAVQHTPSNWQYEAIAARMAQLSAIRGGGLVPSARKAGTYLIFKPTSQVPTVADFLLEAQVESGEQDGIGLVFRWQDIDNFYFFIMSGRHQYYKFGKKVDGVFAELDTGGLSEGAGYNSNTRYRVKVINHANQLQAYLNDEPIVSGEDNDIADSGRVGLMCHGNSQAYFYRLKLIEFITH